jgi:LPS sulfotransferase NodH
VRRLGQRLPAALKHDRFTRFIVLSRSRTGSNLIVSLLASHPQIDAEGEILNRLRGRNPGDVLDRTFGPQPFFVRAKGFKIFYYHPLDGRSEEVWERLTSMPELAVIHLRRWNVLRTVVSRRIAGDRDEWLTRGEPTIATEAKAVTIGPEELERAFRQTRAWESEGERRFAGHRVFPLWYEGLVADIPGTFAEITAFLGVRYVKPSTDLRRQNPEPLEDLLSNYDELHESMRGTELEAFFTESMTEPPAGAGSATGAD